MLPEWMNKKRTPRDKSKQQEKNAAKRFNGRVTIGSGNRPTDKADVAIRGVKNHFDRNTVRLEAKRTDYASIKIEKKWFDKLERETLAKEFWAVELEIQDKRVYIISEREYKFLLWLLTESASNILIRGGNDGNLQGSKQENG